MKISIDLHLVFIPILILIGYMIGVVVQEIRAKIKQDKEDFDNYKNLSNE